MSVTVPVDVGGGRPALGLRLATWLHRYALEQQLAEGANPDADPRLALRARQLTSVEYRRKLAARLDGVLDDANRPRPVLEAVPLQRADVREAREALVALADRLRDPEPVTERGAALTLLLLADGGGPLYVRGPGAVWQYARATTIALDAHGR